MNAVLHCASPVLLLFRQEVNRGYSLTPFHQDRLIAKFAVHHQDASRGHRDWHTPMPTVHREDQVLIAPLRGLAKASCLIAEKYRHSHRPLQTQRCHLGLRRRQQHDAQIPKHRCDMSLLMGHMTTPLNRSLATTSTSNSLFALFLHFNKFIVNEFVTLARCASQSHSHRSNRQTKNCADWTKQCTTSNR